MSEETHFSESFVRGRERLAFGLGELFSQVARVSFTYEREEIWEPLRVRFARGDATLDDVWQAMQKWSGSRGVDEPLSEEVFDFAEAPERLQ